jgi:hypothetical protein
MTRRDGQVGRQVLPDHRRRVGVRLVLEHDRPAAQRQPAQAEEVREFHALVGHGGRGVALEHRLARDRAVRRAHDAYGRSLQFDAADAERARAHRERIERERGARQVDDFDAVASVDFGVRDQPRVAQLDRVRKPVRKLGQAQVGVEVIRHERFKLATQEGRDHARQSNERDHDAGNDESGEHEQDAPAAAARFAA